jgi:hypothetical protein
MSLIQSNPRFKKDCDRYNQAIKECKDEAVKIELKSLYEQFLSLVKQIDTSFGILVTERMINSTQRQEIQNQLSSIRAQLEKKVASIKTA